MTKFKAAKGEQGGHTRKHSGSGAEVFDTEMLCCKEAYILCIAYVFSHVCCLFIPHNRFHNSGPVASIVGDRKAADMSKTSAHTYRIYPCLRILPISSYSLYVVPGAIRLAESTILCQGACLQTGSFTGVQTNVHKTISTKPAHSCQLAGASLVGGS